MFKSTTRGFVALLMVLFVSGLSAQLDSTNYYTADEIFLKAFINYNNEEYEVAYRTFETVNYNDTAYYDAKMEAISALVIQNKYDTVITLCRDLLKKEKFNPDKWQFINSLGHALIQKKRYEEAITEIDNGLEEFPRHYLLWFNRGSACYELKRYDEAVEAFQMCIRYNPTYKYGHMRLGLICAEAGDLTRAALCMNMTIYADAGNSESIEAIKLLGTIYEGGIEKKIDKLTFKEEESFEDIDLLIRNKIADNDDYKTGSKLNYSFIRYNHLVFSTMEYDPESNDFWNQTYVRFYKEIMNLKYFPQFSYYQSLSVNNAKTQKIITKNKAKIIVFRDWSFDFFSKCMNERKVWDGKDYVQNKLRCCGDFGFREEVKTVDDIIQGPFIAYHGNGNISAKGELSSAGLKEGVWKYYDEDGCITSEEENVKGALEGTYITFYKNGSRKFQAEVFNDKALAERIRYYNYNQIYSKEQFNSEGEQDGLSIYYHPNGQVSEKVMFKNGKRNGDYISYHPNGQIREKLNYKDDERVGDYNSYYNNGKENTVGKFEADKHNGHWKYSHKNGQLNTEGEMKDGYRIGIWKSYRENGSMEEESDYGTTGKKTGIYREFNGDGKLIIELHYKGEDIVNYKVFNSKEELVREGELKKGFLEFENYHDNGKLKTKGNFVKGNRNGEWKFYDVNGNIELLEVYNDNGDLHGESKEYFANGDVSVSKYYKNGLLDGYFVEYFKNGRILREGWYRDNSPVGEWKFYYADGVVSHDRYFIDGNLNGESRFFDEKGRIEKIEYYYFGTMEKLAVYDTTGVKISDHVLKDGAGEFKIPNSFNGVAEEVNYKGVEVDGLRKFYYGNGKIMAEGIFASDNKEGEWKYYHRNGKISSEGSYVNGMKEGIWKWYFENGQLNVEENYHFDEREGKSMRYYENGTIDVIRNYHEDKRDGEQISHDPNGVIQYIRYYKEGELLGYSYIGNDEKPMPMISCDVQDGNIIAKFPNGNLSYKCTYKNGFNEGEITLYYENGSISETGTYLRDELDGVYKEFYTNGQIMSEINYKDGNLNGVMKTWYANGKLKSIENYIHDDLYGWAEYYDENGKLKEKSYLYNDFERKEQ